MKVSYISSMLPVIILATIRASAYPIRQSSSTIVAREAAFLDDAPLALRSEDELQERGITKVLNKLHITKPAAQVTAAQKSAKVWKAQVKQSNNIKNHHAAVAKVEQKAGWAGLQTHFKDHSLTPYEKNIGTKLAKEGWNTHHDLKQFKHVNVGVESHPNGVRHVTAKYHNANNDHSHTVQYRHHDSKDLPKVLPPPSTNRFKKAVGKVGAFFKPKPKQITQAEKNARITQLDKKLSDSHEKHVHKLAQIEHNPSGGLKVNFRGPEHDKKLAEEKVRWEHKTFGDLKKFSHVDVHTVHDGPKSKQFEAKYHHGDPNKIGHTATTQLLHHY